jgi:hypothetical protein
MSMPVWLVDDRDGRVVAELESQDEALRVLEALAQDGGNLPEWYCLVELDSRHGAIIGMDTSLKIRPLPH